MMSNIATPFYYIFLSPSPSNIEFFCGLWSSAPLPLGISKTESIIQELDQPDTKQCTRPRRRRVGRWRLYEQDFEQTGLGPEDL